MLTTVNMEDDTSSQEARNEMARLWRTWRTVHEMLRDRVGKTQHVAFSPVLRYTNVRLLFVPQGYEIAEEELKIDLQDFASKYSDQFGYPA